MSASWQHADVPAMWESAQSADTPIAWRQVTGWQTTYELLDQHQLTLRRCRDELAIAWPPERSQAARSFLGYMDALLVSIDQAKADAASNQMALAQVLTSLSEAKRDLAELKKRWDEYADEEEAFRTNQVELVQLSGGPNWRANLNRIGRERMARADQEVFESSEKMVVPTPFSLPPYDNSRPFDIAAPVGDDADFSGSRGDGSDSSHLFVGLARDSASKDGSPRSARPEIQSSGIGNLQMSGAIGSRSESSNYPVLATSGAINAGLGRLEMGSIDVGDPIRSSDSQSSPSILPGSGLPIAPAVGARLIPGEINSKTGDVFSRTGANVDGDGATTRRINPVGGVVGEAASRPMLSLPVAGSSSGRMSQRDRAEVSTTYEWSLGRGVRPVLEPLPERSYSPGPGVFGIDR